jgi:hypothetical protein
MDPQLVTLVNGPDGYEALIGQKLQHHLPGSQKPFWCWPTSLDDTWKAYWVQDEFYRDGPFPVPLDQLAIGIGERESNDPLIILLRRKGMNVSPFLKPVPPPTPPAPLNIPAAPVNTPGVGFVTPLPTFGAEIPAEQTQAFQRALLSIVQRGSLTDMMDTIITDYGPGKEHRAWRSKAKYLMNIYREGDAKVAHVKAGVLFLATRINFVSADLEYLTNAYISEMFVAKVARKGPSSTWKMTTDAELDNLAREKYADFRARADEQVFKGHAKPMYDPSQSR